MYPVCDVHDEAGVSHEYAVGVVCGDAVSVLCGDEVVGSCAGEAPGAQHRTASESLGQVKACSFYCLGKVLSTLRGEGYLASETDG